MTTYIVLVCGGRDYGLSRLNQDDPGFLKDMERANRQAMLLFDTLDAERYVRGGEQGNIAIICGGANGADRLAATWAAKNELPCMIYPAQWGKYGPSAGPKRNQEMLDKALPNLVIAFPGGQGTADMVRRAKSKNIPVMEIRS